MEEKDTNNDDYISSEAFKANLESQEKYFNEYLDKQHKYYNHPLFPRDFMHNYFVMRASLSSLRNNPDTKDDPDFIELCNTWKDLGFDSFIFELGHLKEIYNKLLKKPNFKNNPYFTSYLYGSFMKGVYELFTCGYYSRPFFSI